MCVCVCVSVCVCMHVCVCVGGLLVPPGADMSGFSLRWTARAMSQTHSHRCDGMGYAIHPRCGLEGWVTKPGVYSKIPHSHFTDWLIDLVNYSPINSFIDSFIYLVIESFFSSIFLKHCICVFLS